MNYNEMDSVERRCHATLGLWIVPLIGGAVLGYGCSDARPVTLAEILEQPPGVISEQALREALPFDSVRLARSGCGIGQCPTYDAVVRRDGSASFEGHRSVAKIGTWAAHAPARPLARLSLLLERAVQDYEVAESSGVEIVQDDGWEFRLSVWRTGADTPVRFEGYEDTIGMSLWTAGSALDGVLQSLDWERPPG
jgi:hypothetical protein